MNAVVLSGAGIRIEDVATVARDRREVGIESAVLERLAKARAAKPVPPPDRWK